MDLPKIKIKINVAITATGIAIPTTKIPDTLPKKTNKMATARVPPT